MHFKDLIIDKKVVLVGPASYMVDSNFGEKIDSHDIVVRLNRGCELVEKYSKDIGTRTDVLYSSLIEQPENAGKWDYSLFVEQFKIKYLCTTPAMSMKGISNASILHPMVNKNKYYELSKHLPCRIVEHEFFTKIALEVDCRPTTGYISIFDILKHKPKLLSIYGFDFYLSGWLPEYKEGMKNITLEEIKIKTLKSKRHSHKNMWNHCKRLLDRKDVLLDERMHDVLSLKNWWFDQGN